MFSKTCFVNFRYLQFFIAQSSLQSRVREMLQQFHTGNVFVFAKFLKSSFLSSQILILWE